jgi:hypothetical protein
MSRLSEIREGIADRIRTAGIDSQVNVFSHRPKDWPLPAIVVEPAGEIYIDYHGSFGAGRLQTVNLTVKVYIPEGGSAESADLFMDECLSSGTGESLSLADAITGPGLPIGDVFGDVVAGNAENYLWGSLNLAQVTPVISCEIPVAVNFYRS